MSTQAIGRSFSFAYRPRITARCLAILLLMAGMLSCDPKREAPATEEAREILPVRVQQVSRQTIIEYERAESTIRPLAEVMVVSKQIGVVQQLDVDAGDTVEKNQVLVRLNNAETALALRGAKSNWEAQEREFQSSKDLVENGYLSKQAFERITLARDQAKNTWERLRVHAQEETIRAPIAGTVLQRRVELGQQVSVGTPLMTIADQSTLLLRMPIREQALQRIRVGQSATVTLRALQDAQLQAEVTKIFPAVDPSTGTIDVELRLLQEELADGTKIRPGMYARGEINVRERENVLVIPRQAIVEEGDTTYVFVLHTAADPSDDSSNDHAATRATSTVRRLPVATGWSGRGLIEITSGLVDGDRVVTLGQGRLHEGSLVRVVEDQP